MNILRTTHVARAVTISLLSAVSCGVLILFVLRGTLSSGVGQTVATAIVYVLPLMALQIVTDAELRRRADAFRFPLDWIFFGGAELTLVLVAAGIGSAVVLLLGILSKWQDLYLANRIMVVVSMIVLCMIRLYATTRSLEGRNRQLQEKVLAEERKLRLHEQDFERAREIQEALMPKQMPQLRACQLAAVCQPARIVGGDYYDAIRLGDSSIAVVIGDVSGKGMAAALLMSNLQAIVRAFAHIGLEPRELCAKANQLIAATVAPGKYITFFYAVVDSARMRLDYCNAGHSPPMLRHRNGTLETLGDGGPVLGVFPGACYAGGTAELRTEDCLVLFTDGITEAMNAKDEEFGEERLMAVLSRCPGSAEECRAQITGAVTQFSNGVFHDDATVLVMRMK